jgi:hypothetical protein
MISKISIGETTLNFYKNLDDFDFSKTISRKTLNRLQLGWKINIKIIMNFQIIFSGG